MRRFSNMTSICDSIFSVVKKGHQRIKGAEEEEALEEAQGTCVLNQNK